MAALLGSFFVSLFVRVGNFILEEEGEVKVNSFSSNFRLKGEAISNYGKNIFGVAETVLL
jgi:hypothetical protein